MLTLYVKKINNKDVILTWEGEGSLKHEMLKENAINTIVKKVKNRIPNTIKFNDELLSSLIKRDLSEYDVYVKDNGKVYYDAVFGYNKLDKEQEQSDTFEITVGHAYNHIQAKILDESGYTYEMKKLENNLVKFIVNC